MFLIVSGCAGVPLEVEPLNLSWVFLKDEGGTSHACIVKSEAKKLVQWKRQCEAEGSRRGQSGLDRYRP
jgi:hypothetical protein